MCPIFKKVTVVSLKGKSYTQRNQFFSKAFKMNNTLISTAPICQHLETIEENYSTICIKCALIISTNALTNHDGHFSTASSSIFDHSDLKDHGKVQLFKLKSQVSQFCYQIHHPQITESVYDTLQGIIISKSLRFGQEVLHAMIVCVYLNLCKACLPMNPKVLCSLTGCSCNYQFSR